MTNVSVRAEDIYNDESFPRNLRHVLKDLCSIIDLDYGLLDELFSVSVLSDEEIAMIRSQKTPDLMNRRMLEILVSNYPSKVGKFMACLQRTLQIHVFNYIRYKGGQHCSLISHLYHSFTLPLHRLWLL